MSGGAPLSLSLELPVMEAKISSQSVGETPSWKRPPTRELVSLGETKSVARKYSPES